VVAGAAVFSDACLADCDYVKGYGPVDFSPCVLSVNDYITIVSIFDDVDGHTCEGETFHVIFDAVLTDGCNGDTDCTFQLEGNNLTGSYQITNISSGCLTLCRCQ
jgi:hypothetical protein